MYVLGGCNLLAACTLLVFRVPGKPQAEASLDSRRLGPAGPVKPYPYP